MTPEEEAKNALLAAHPNALRACRSVKRAIGYVFLGSLIPLLPFSILLPIVLSRISFFQSNMWWLFFRLYVQAANCVVYVCFPLLIILVLVWLVIVTFFFARYSLAQLLNAILIGGACGTGIVALPWPWRYLPIIVLGVLLVCVFMYLAQQDPDRPAYLPAFLKKAMQARKRPNGGGE